MASVHVNVLVVLSHSFQCPLSLTLSLFYFFFPYLILLFFLTPLLLSPFFFFFKFHPSKISLVPSYLFTLGHFRPLFLLYSLPQIHFRIPSRSPCAQRSPAHLTILFVPQLRPFRFITGQIEKTLAFLEKNSSLNPSTKSTNYPCR